MDSTWAVVTGASSGLGVAFAHRLASEGANIVLAARSEDRLEQVAADLRSRHGVRTRVSPVDLSSPDGRAGFVEEVSRTPVSHLINNAGFGTLGEFADIDPARVTQELELDVVALTELSRAVVPGMASRGRGAIVNVASTAAFQPIPGMAVYAAAKAYVLRFSCALWDELHATGVRAIAVCPGPTQTAFFANAGNAEAMGRRRTPEQVVDTAWIGLKRHRPYTVDGLGNWGLALTAGLAPVRLQTLISRGIVSR